MQDYDKGNYHNMIILYPELIEWALWFRTEWRRIVSEFENQVFVKETSYETLPLAKGYVIWK